MIVVCALLAATVITLVAAGIWRERVHRATVSDLLDRVMARSYGEYAATAQKISTVTRPVRKRVMTDEDMAELEATLSDARATVAGRNQ